LKVDEPQDSQRYEDVEMKREYYYLIYSLKENTSRKKKTSEHHSIYALIGISGSINKCIC
jgi:hypothetical protein